MIANNIGADQPAHLSLWCSQTPEDRFCRAKAHITLSFILGDGPFPGVIDMFGTVGGLFEFRSALLASRGFATYCLPYFAYDDLPPTLVDLDLEYFLVCTT